MSISDISLTSAMRNTLTSLQSTATLMDRTQNRLATGKKVNSALDNPVNFFAAQNATQRASDLSSRKDGMSEAIQGVLAANNGVTGITSLIESAKGLTQSAQSSDRAGRNMLAGQFNTILDQITQMASDSQYKGKNFLGGDTLQVLFNENGSSFINIQGFSADATTLGLSAATVGTNDVTTANQNGGSGVSTAATAVHGATLNATFGGSTINTGYFFNEAAAAPLLGAGALGISGSAYTGNSPLQIDITTIAQFNATGTTFTGLSASAADSGYVLAQVYANGIALTSGAGGQYTGIWNGTVLNLSLQTGLMAVNGLTGQANISITYDIKIQKHIAGTNNIAGSNVFYYDLGASSGGVADTASGAQVGGLVSGTLNPTGTFSGAAGQQVYIVSGGTTFIANQSTYFFTTTGTQSLLVFTGAAAPPTALNQIYYNYNTGYSTFTGPQITSRSAFTGITLAANQYITNVKVNGATASHFTITNNVINFSGGSEPAAGASVTYDVVTGGTTGTWETDANISSAIDKLDAALSTLRTSSQTLGSTQNILDIRSSFTDSLTSVLLKGADNLTLADMNEEGANMLMLQTRQSLGTSTLKMASDSAQSILRLF